MQAETLLILLSWARMLSGYPGQPLPPVEFVSHEYLVTHACYNVECNVRGWYNDTGTVYIDEDYSDLTDGFTASLVVHEFTHYLQHKSGSWPHATCEARVSREREAYFVQQQYIDRALTFNVRIMPMNRGCNK